MYGRALSTANGLQRIADAGMNGGVVLGSPIEAASIAGPSDSSTSFDTLLSTLVSVQVLVHGCKTTSSSEMAVLRHPVDALAWLANHLISAQTSSQSGFYGGGSVSGLRAGDLVVGGSIVRMAVNAFSDYTDCSVIADFGKAFGQVQFGGMFDASKL